MSSGGDRSSLVPVAVCALAILYLTGLEDHDLWTPDEPRVASVGRQTAEGAWVVPTLNGQPFLEEPPLHAWCVAALYNALGFEPACRARWISALFGLGGLAVAYGIGSTLGGRRVGLFAALTLGLSIEYFATAHRVIVDGALTFFTTLSAFACLRGVTAAGALPRLGWLALGYSSASAAFLAKGPIGLAAPALAVAGWAIATRDAKVFLRAQPWLAPACFALVAGPWLYALHLQTGSQGLETLLADNLLGRVLPADEGERGHIRGPWFYFVMLPADLLPAAVFVAGGVIDRVRRGNSLAPEERSLYDFGLAWLALGFVMLTIASTKRPVYMVPFFPAAALVGGLWLEAYVSGKAGGILEQWFALVLAGSMAALAIALPLSRAFVRGVSIPWALGGMVLTLAAAAWIFREALRGRRARALTAWLCGIVCAVLAAGFVIVPAIDSSKSLGGVTKTLAALVPHDRPICAFGADETTRGMFPLYAGRPLKMLPDPLALEYEIQQHGEAFLFVIEKRGRRSAFIEYLKPLDPVLLHEDIREGSRAFRLFHVR